MKLYRALRITAGDVLALTGGGGKTTTMFRLADELADHPSTKIRVLTTTSTRIFSGQIQQSPAHVVFDPAHETINDILPRLDLALAEHHQVLLTRPIEEKKNKAVGLALDTIDALADTGHFDVIIVEADGARQRPFKAPAAYEPVFPASTTKAIPMVGLDVLGQPLDDESVHRVALVSQLTGTNLGEPVTIDTVAAVLTHPQGGLRNLPSQAQVVPLLNKAEDSVRITAAQALAAKLLTCTQIDSVVIGSVQNRINPIIERHGRTAAIILAAGGSTRFGSPKQLARWGEQTFIEQVIDAALTSQVDHVVVVLGANAGLI